MQDAARRSPKVDAHAIMCDIATRGVLQRRGRAFIGLIVVLGVYNRLVEAIERGRHRQPRDRRRSSFPCRPRLLTLSVAAISRCVVSRIAGVLIPPIARLLSLVQSAVRARSLPLTPLDHHE